MKICNFGSLNIDHVYTVDRFVLPGETISSKSYRRFAGGKELNQSIACARAGASVHHAGAIGNDGLFLKETLECAGVDVSLVKVVDGPSGHAVIQVDRNGSNCIIIHCGANSAIDENFVDDALERFSPGDMLLLQNEISRLPYIVRRGHDRGMIIVLNLSPITADIGAAPLELISFFILNEIEGAALSGESAPELILEKLCRRYPQAGIALTLGPRGVMYGKGTGRDFAAPPSVKAVDTTAAGDTFTGYFCASLAAGMPVHQALVRACAAAALCVTRPGAADSIPFAHEVFADNFA